MEYISAKEAAAKWGITEESVQTYCNEGQIDGAVNLGKSWAVPITAEKPEGTKKEVNKKSEAETITIKKSSEKLRTAMPLINTPYKLGEALKSIEKIEDRETRSIALAEYYYFSGQSSKASDIVEEYLTHSDISLRLSACWLYAYANLALDRIPRTKQAMTQVRETVMAVSEDTPALYRAFAICIATGASILLHLPLPENATPVKKCVHMLPPGLKLFSLYIEAHHAYLNKQYGVAIGIAETALALETELYPIPSIYLHLVAAMGHINLKQSEQAKTHLLEAWDIARPDDMIEAFGEHHGLLGGVLEAAIKKDYPNDFRRMIDITYSFSAGWRKIHNPYTGHFVADDLTTTEFTVAMLAARSWSNKEISSHLSISTNTVKCIFPLFCKSWAYPNERIYHNSCLNELSASLSF
ncbi:MAG: helix-turn-helix transcriptional regulator [Eubacterium sp.]|nr:helix-turn-helix transcriptional regulator [Eubacterium sp.]